MPAAKDYFSGDPKEVADALNKAKKKGECVIAFGVGKQGSLIAVDFRSQQTTEKFLKQIRSGDFSKKYVVGKGKINGTLLTIQAEESKGTIKPTDIKAYLKEIGSTVTKAEITEAKGDGPPGKK